MPTRILRSALTALLASLVLTAAAWAKGPPSKVIIAGPGLAGEVEITDPETLQAFSFFQFENIYRKVDAPPDPGEGYVVTRYIENGLTLIPWDRVIYYPEIHVGPDGK